MQINIKGIVQEILIRRTRVERALADPHTSERVRTRILDPEMLILNLALEGAAVYSQKNRETEAVS